LTVGYQSKGTGIDYTIWPLLKLTSELDLNELSIVMLRSTVQKLEEGNKSFKVESAFLTVMKASMVHIWLFYISLAAQRNQTHQANAPLFDYNSVMIIAESLKSIISILIDLDEKEIERYANIF